MSSTHTLTSACVYIWNVCGRTLVPCHKCHVVGNSTKKIKQTYKYKCLGANKILRTTYDKTESC